MAYTDEYGTTFSDDRKRIIKFNSSWSEYSIPDGTEVIAVNAFKGNQSIKVLHLPSSVRLIESGALEKCKIEEIHFAGNIEKWLQITWKCCFSQGYKLYFNETEIVESIIIPESVSVIKSRAFYYCTSLHSVIFNRNVTAIERDAFNKSGLRGIISIPRSCKTIKEYAFFNCTGITKIKIPEATNDIWYGAFSACYGLQGFVVSPSNNKFFTDGIGLYAYAKNTNKSQLELVALASGSKQNYRLQENTVSIYGEACCFNSIPGSELEIPHKLKVINNAFRNCRGSVKAPITLRKTILDQGLPSDKFKTVFVYQEALLSHETPAVISLNPFRVLGVYCDASQKEIQSNAAKIKRFLEIGKQPSFPVDFDNILPPLNRTQEMVDKALSQISQPKEKLAYALLWFSMPRNEQQQMAETLLRDKKYKEACNHLIEQNRDLRISLAPYICLSNQDSANTNNLGILDYVYICHDCVDYHRVDEETNNINESYVGQICGSNFSITDDELQVLFLDKLATFLNPIHLWGCAKSYNLSDFATEHLFDISIGQNISNINSQIASSKSIDKNDSPKNLKAAVNLKEKTIEDIAIVDEYLLQSDVRSTSIHDSLANQILQLAIDSYNHADNRSAIARDIYSLMEYAKSLAKGDLLRSRCEENLKTIKEVIDELPPIGLEKTDKELYAIFTRSRNSADTIQQASALLKEAEPHLFKIKLQHLAEKDSVVAHQIQSYFTKVSTAIANVCLNKIIEDINTSRINKNSSAWQIITALNQLPLDSDFKKKRYDENVEILLKNMSNGYQGIRHSKNEIAYDLIDLRTEKEVWEDCKRNNNYNPYIHRFPNGPHIEEARELQKKIQPVVIKQEEPLTTKELETIFANRPLLSDETIRQAEERIAAEKRRQLLIRIAEKEAEKKRNGAVAEKERQQQKGESSKWIIVVALVSLLVFLALLLPIFLSEDNKTQSSDYGYGDAYDTTAVVEEFEDSVAAVEEFADNDYSSEETASKHHALDELSVEDKWQAKYLGNQLTNGAQPYRSLYGKNKQSGTSEIVVTAPTDRDALVMVKNGSDRVIRHAYIRSGMRYTFHISAGYYQVYFICGKDWCPEKKAPNGQMGYFLHSSVSKDSQTYIDDYQSLTYTLQSMANGNFMPQDASSYEAF